MIDLFELEVLLYSTIFFFLFNEIKIKFVIKFFCVCTKKQIKKQGKTINRILLNGIIDWNDLNVND